MKIEGVKDNYIMMAKKELEACNWLITGELEILERVEKTCVVLSGWAKNEAQNLEEIKSALNQLKFQTTGGEQYVIYGTSSIVTRDEYAEFVKKYTETIKNYKACGSLCIKLDDLLQNLSQAM